MGGAGIFVKGHLWDMPGGAYEGRGGGAIYFIYFTNSGFNYNKELVIVTKAWGWGE